MIDDRYMLYIRKSCRAFRGFKKKNIATVETGYLNPARGRTDLRLACSFGKAQIISG